MPTVNGTLTNTSPDTFAAFFVVDETPYVFHASYRPPVIFSSSHATLTYDDITKLPNTTDTFKGDVGPTALDIKLGSGSTMTGPLEHNIPSTIHISGNGTWIID